MINNDDDDGRVSRIYVKAATSFNFRNNRMRCRSVISSSGEIRIVKNRFPSLPQIILDYLYEDFDIFFHTYY